MRTSRDAFGSPDVLGSPLIINSGFTIVGSIGAIETDIARKTLKLTGKICSRQTGAPSFDEIYLEEMRAFIERIETGRDKLADWRAGVAAMEIVLQARKLSGLP